MHGVFVGYLKFDGSSGTLVASLNRRGKQEWRLRIDTAIDVAWLEMIENCPMNRSCPRSAPSLAAATFHLISQLPAVLPA